MKKIILSITFVGILISFNSCVSPEEPANDDMLIGQWNIIEVYVDEQTEGSLQLFDFIVFERNGTFTLEDDNGLHHEGGWNENGTVLTMTATNGTVYVFEIIFLSYTKMQLLQTITNPDVGDITIRYLFNKTSDGTFYESDYE